MLKRWLALSIVLGFAFSILLPNSFVQAEGEDDDDAATEEEADADDEADEEATDNEEENNDDEGTNEEESDDESEAPASDEPEDPAIYMYVIGFVVVLGVGMYAFTEGTRKE